MNWVPERIPPSALVAAVALLLLLGLVVDVGVAAIIGDARFSAPGPVILGA